MNRYEATGELFNPVTSDLSPEDLATAKEIQESNHRTLNQTTSRQMIYDLIVLALKEHGIQGFN